jgi:hypothetical protein
MRSIIHAAAAVAATGALLAPVAFGQGAKPEPGCAGLYPDKKGDVEYANLDITGFWFRAEGGKVTANIRVANLDKSKPQEATGVSWYVLWNDGEAQKFAQVLVEAPLDEVTYHVGTISVTGNNTQRTRETEVTGQFVEGADGVLSVDIPEDLVPSGKQLKSVTSDTKFSIGVPGVLSSLQPADEAAGKPYTVNACEAGGTAPAPAPGPAPAPAPAPSPSPSNTGREVAAGQLDVAAAKKLPKAKKIKKSLAVGISSKSGISEVDAALFQGPIGKNKIVARGKLASAKGKAKLKLKVAKKLKKGTYTLYVVGRNADGKLADKSFKLKLK